MPNENPPEDANIITREDQASRGAALLRAFTISGDVAFAFMLVVTLKIRIGLQCQSGLHVPAALGEALLTDVY